MYLPLHPPVSMELPPSAEGPPTREWVLVGVADSSQLGSHKRLAELEKIKRKAEHGNNHSYVYTVITFLQFTCSSRYIYQTAMNSSMSLHLLKIHVT